METHHAENAFRFFVTKSHVTIKLMLQPLGIPCVEGYPFLTTSTSHNRLLIVTNLVLGHVSRPPPVPDGLSIDFQIRTANNTF